MSEEVPVHKVRKYAHVIVTGRRNGKTTKALQWLKQARRVTEYPYWDRVLIVHTWQVAQDLRIELRQEAEAQGIDGSGLYYNLVYSVDEWKTAHISIGWRGSIAVDNADLILEQLLRKAPALITMTGQVLANRDPRTI